MSEPLKHATVSVGAITLLPGARITQGAAGSANSPKAGRAGV